MGEQRKLDYENENIDIQEENQTTLTEETESSDQIEETGQSELGQEERNKEIQELVGKQMQVKEEMDNGITNVEEVSEFIDEDGNILPARQQGKVELKMLDIENDIVRVRRFREKGDEVYALQDSIRRWGLLEPVHVVPYGDYYILVQGYRRLQAYIHMGKTSILALVDATIPPELAKYYQVELNNTLEYKFIEKLNYGKYVETTQPQISAEVIEQSLGLKTGEYFKMKYIEQFKNDFPDIFMQVQNGRLSIEQAYKRIEKEIEKQQKEADQEEELEEKMGEEADLSELNVEANQQELGKRKILDPVIRRSVESRAGGACECCGYGKGVPDLMGAFQVHHIVAVQYGGSDSKLNLILLCHNCHKLVHDYESARFTPEQETYDRRNDVKRIVVLGNILLHMKKKALLILRQRHENIGRQVDKGVYSVGKGLEKAQVILKGEKEDFDGSPYDTFLTATENLNFGGTVTGSLSQISMEDPEVQLEVELEKEEVEVEEEQEVEVELEEEVEVEVEEEDVQDER